jgi:hypothetical protein
LVEGLRDPAQVEVRREELRPQETG